MNGLFQYEVMTAPVFGGTLPPTDSRWFQPLSYPIQTIARKSIVGAGIALIASGLFAPSPFPIPNPTPVDQTTWRQPLTEPVRQPNGLKPYLHQVLAWEPKTLPFNPDVVGILAATEINRDVFFAGAIIYNSVETGIVSIREIPAIDGGAASIEES